MIIFHIFFNLLSPACLNSCMTNAINKKQARRDIDHYLRTFSDTQNAVAVTLTQKQIVDHQHIDDIVSSDNLRHFMSRLNAAVYGKRFRRFNKRLSVFVVRENSADVRHHLHLMLERPPYICLDDFRYNIFTCWSKTRFGHLNIKVDEAYDLSGWTDYILKRRTKSNWYDAIDWENCYLQTSLA